MRLEWEEDEDVFGETAWADGLVLVVTPLKWGTVELDVLDGADLLHRSQEPDMLAAKVRAAKLAAQFLAA